MANTYTLSLNSASAQYADAGNPAALQLTNNFTIECYINPSLTLEHIPEVLVAKLDDVAGKRSWAFKINTSALLNLQVSSDGSGLESKLDTTTLTETCTHVAVTFASGTIKFYVNGVLSSTQTSTATSVFNTAATLKLGAEYVDVSVIGEAYTGTIDDVRVWNVVRSAAEILANYQRELAGNESGLVAYWKLNNSYTDATTNAITLSPNGLPSFISSVCFADATTTSTSTTTTSTSSSTTTTSTSTTTTSTSTSTSTSTTTSTTTTRTTTSTTTTSTSTTSTSSSTTTTSTSTSTTTSTSTSTTMTIDLKIIVEKVK